MMTTADLKSRFLKVVDYILARLAEPTTRIALASIFIALGGEAAKFDNTFTIIAGLAGLITVAIRPEKTLP